MNQGGIEWSWEVWRETRASENSTKLGSVGVVVGRRNIQTLPGERMDGSAVHAAMLVSMRVRFGRDGVKGLGLEGWRVGWSEQMGASMTSMIEIHCGVV